MAHFAVRLVHGPGWDSTRPIREQDGWDEHAAFMDGLVDDGFVILGGPVGNGEQTLHVVEAVNEQDVKTRFARDPWASARLLQIGVIEPWALWLDGVDGLTAAEPDVVQAVSASKPARLMIRAAGPTRSARVRPRGRDIDIPPSCPTCLAARPDHARIATVP